MTHPDSPPSPSIWGKIARFLAVAAPLVAWLNTIANIRMGIGAGRSSILDSGPELSSALVGIAGVCALVMAYLIRRMIRQAPGPAEVFGLLGLAAFPWIASLLGIWASGNQTLSDPASAGLWGYGAMVARQAQGTLFGWSLLGSATFALVVVTFIRRARPVSESDALPVALAVLPSVIFAVLAVPAGDLGLFAAGVIGDPVSALILLPFVGAATRRSPPEGTVLPGIGAALGFALSFTAALSAAFGVGIERMMFALSSTAGVGVEAVQAGLTELSSARRLPIWGILVALLPAVVIAVQLRRGGRAIQPAFAAAIALLLIPLGLQSLVTSKTHATLERLAVARPAEPALTPADTTAAEPTISPVDTVTGVPGGVVGGVVGGMPSGGVGGVLGGVVESAAPISPPQLISSVPPEYPAIARQAQIGGTVVVAVEIDSAGRVSNATVLKSAHPVLDGAAVEAVRRWRYRPAMQDGRPVPGKRIEQVTFRSQEEN
ncbi:MAG: energy transducer TonB [Gemmatimonadales bacterium]